MSEPNSASKNGFRWFALLLGVGLLSYLVARTGPRALWHDIRSTGYGIAIIIALGGVTHLVKTWAWRRTFTCDISHLTWRRSFGMRLVSEAIGQLGIAGKVFGEGVRVSLLGSAVPISNAVSAAALDSGLYILASVVVAIAGILISLIVAPLPGGLRVYAFLFAALSAGVLILIVAAAKNSWRAIGATFRGIARLPGCKNWVSKRLATIDATERNLLNFHREAPAAFRTSLLLNFLAHVLAITEVFIVLRLLTPKATLLGALVLEALTKLINAVGAVNPGNIGTYEGGNMLIARLFGLTAAGGLTLALCRRARALFWASIGAVCLMVMRRPDSNTEVNKDGVPEKKDVAIEAASQIETKSWSKTVIILANWEEGTPGFCPALAPLATLPLLLRNILTIHKNACRIIVSVRSESAQEFRSVLSRTGRMSSVEWKEVGDADLLPVIAELASTSNSVLLVSGSRSYQPHLLHSAIDWDGQDCLALLSAGESAGVYALSQTAALDLADSQLHVRTLAELHRWIVSRETAELDEVPANSWQKVTAPEDISESQRKLESWLIKPTDGIFARMNRRVSTPISRQLIKFPVTPNMVTFFVLGVSIACGAFYALGGYWNCLIAALLAVAGSILDGCDGEVARFKLQSTKLGCWLDSICDYLYYMVAFAGMGTGLARNSGSRAYLLWGGVLLFGAMMTILVMSFTRQRLAGSQPEKLLAIWQKKAESRSSNPLLYFGRQCEFIIRRCFHPYAFVFFALFDATNVVFITSAIGANIAWLIALYSYFKFTRPETTSQPDAGAVISDGASA